MFDVMVLDEATFDWMSYSIDAITGTMAEAIQRSLARLVPLNPMRDAAQKCHDLAFVVSDSTWWLLKYAAYRKILIHS